jgi:hypothetical protein
MANPAIYYDTAGPILKKSQEDFLYNADMPRLQTGR